MAVNVISKSSAFSTGSDLWILPNYGQSRWTPTVDWYLNFQIYKFHNKVDVQISEHLKNILKATEFKYKTDFKETPPGICLLGSSHLLPNRWVGILDFESDDFSKWMASSYKISKNLNFPSLRLFLPPGRSASELSLSSYPDFHKSDITVVLDS